MRKKMPVIKLDTITKIEGHARLKVKVKKGEVKEARIEVYEGARFFEGILKGRRYDEVAHLASRICGVCSQAHLITALKAIEEALNIKNSEQTELLRELLLIGQIIQSHSLHLYFLGLPDYLGFENAIAMASKYPKEVKRALKIKRLGNDICTKIGGREVHSITAVLGGFSKIPKQEELDELLKEVKTAKKEILKTVNLFENLLYPKFERKTEYIALRKENTYALLHGNISSTEGLNITHDLYNEYLEEYAKGYSTAKFVVSEGKGYMVGALARLNLNRRMLSKDARIFLKKSKFNFPNYSPFVNNFAQALELVHLVDRAIEILENLRIRDEKPIKFKPKSGHGISATEAPRGMLIHEYELNKKGDVAKANIITPTTQNLKNIEDDIKVFLPGILDKSEDEVKLELEKLIRSYDPCISCSTHFLKLDLKRE
jgi:coenzyme F420-reducing hydrogenase alpha subunit